MEQNSNSQQSINPKNIDNSRKFDNNSLQQLQEYMLIVKIALDEIDQLK